MNNDHDRLESFLTTIKQELDVFSARFIDSKLLPPSDAFIFEEFECMDALLPYFKQIWPYREKIDIEYGPFEQGDYQKRMSCFCRRYDSLSSTGFLFETVRRLCSFMEVRYMTPDDIQCITIDITPSANIDDPITTLRLQIGFKPNCT